MNKKDIESRDDINLLVTSFYSKVRLDATLSPYFSSIDDWDIHIEKLTTFWQSSIFLNAKYTGDPLKAHIKVDRESTEKLEQKHFGKWMNLWFETIDELFEGERALIAKNRARKMSTFLYLKIFESRSKN